MTSITDELREYAEDWDWLDTGAEIAQDRIEAIADRIEAEHERQLEVLYRDMSDAEYVKLPKDADGEPIHLGDKVYQVKGGWVYTVKSISFYPNNTTVTFECEHGFGSDSAHNVRHYHAPTVEDVLTEFGIDWEHESDCEDRAALLKEYAAKLRLAEED